MTFSGRSCAKVIPVRVSSKNNNATSIKVYAIIDEQGNRTLAKSALFDFLISEMMLKKAILCSPVVDSLPKMDAEQVDLLSKLLTKAVDSTFQPLSNVMKYQKIDTRLQLLK